MYILLTLQHGILIAIKVKCYSLVSLLIEEFLAKTS